LEFAEEFEDGDEEACAAWEVWGRGEWIMGGFWQGAVFDHSGVGSWLEFWGEEFGLAAAGHV
jgi:hypothetical protein